MPRCSNSSSGSFPHCISDSSAPQKTQNTTLFISSQMFSLSPITCPLTMKRFKNLVAVDTGWLQQQTGAAIYLLSPVNTIWSRTLRNVPFPIALESYRSIHMLWIWQNTRRNIWRSTSRFGVTIRRALWTLIRWCVLGTELCAFLLQVQMLCTCTVNIIFLNFMKK